MLDSSGTLRFIGMLPSDAFEGNGYKDEVLGRMFAKSTSKESSALIRTRAAMGQSIFLSHGLRNEILHGVPSISSPIRLDTLFDSAGWSSSRTAIN